MRISVEQLNGETLVLEVTPEMQMREVKEQIKDMQTWEDELSRDTTVVEVIFGDRKLANNDETLAQVGLSADSIVSAILRQNIARCSNKGGIGPDVDPETLVIVEIPDSEIEIADDAFGFCKAVAKVTIPNSVGHIGDSAFICCSALRNVTIGDSVELIEQRAFSCCTSLSSVTIPDSVLLIGDEAFAGCSALRHVTIPNSVRRIADGAFTHCTSLTSITIPDSVTHIERNAFAGCSSLVSVTIPHSVTSIGHEAFAYCSVLRDVTVPDSVTHISENAFFPLLECPQHLKGTNKSMTCGVRTHLGRIFRSAW